MIKIILNYQSYLSIVLLFTIVTVLITPTIDRDPVEVYDAQWNPIQSQTFWQSLPEMGIWGILSEIGSLHLRVMRHHLLLRLKHCTSILFRQIRNKPIPHQLLYHPWQKKWRFVYQIAGDDDRPPFLISGKHSNFYQK